MCLVSWETVVTKRQSLKLRLLSRHPRISDEKVSIGRSQFEFESWKVFEYPLAEPSWLWLWLSLAPAGNSFDFVLWWITAVGQRTTNNEKWSTNNKQLHTLSCAWPFKSDTIFVIYFDWHLIYDWQLQMLRPTRSTDKRSMGNVTTTTATTTRVTRATTTMFEPTANADTDTNADT